MDLNVEFHHELMRRHLGHLTQDDLSILKATQKTGDIDILLRWYTGRAALPCLKHLWYLPHPNLFILGSWASGKTTNMGDYALTWALTRSFYKFVNIAPVGRQAELMFKFLRNQLVNNERIEHLVTKIREKPYPVIQLWNGSTLEFLTGKPQYMDYLQGEEFDHGNIDEAALLQAFERAVGILSSRLRGVRQRTLLPRSHKLSITTVPGADQALKERYDRGLEDDPDYYSVKITAAENPFVSEEDLRLMMQNIPAEDVPIYMDCQWPDISGRLLPVRHYDACESTLLDIEMYDLLKSGSSGANKKEEYRVGVVKWELPYEPDHYYVVVGDPGTGNPPKRNAGVVMAWDATTEPAEMVYLDWVYGNGSINPWMHSFKYAVEKYPGEKGFDSTSTQKYMSDLVFEREGIDVEPLNFGRDKWGYLNSLRIVLERQLIAFPTIPGMRAQFTRYDLPDDKLAQDLIAGLMMSAWMLRPSLRIHPVTQDGMPRTQIIRGTRGTRRQAVRRRTR